MQDVTLEENRLVPADDDNDFAEELSLEFDASHDPDAIWEWNGESWVAVIA
jgi:hypothetical protein